MKTCYKNARIVLPDAVREGCLMTENDTISAIAFGRVPAWTVRM